MGTRSTRLLRWIALLTLIVAVPSTIYFLGLLFLTVDEVADCKVKQWMAGGKKPPKIDISSNVTVRAAEGHVAVDFRRLDSVWSHICLTSFYAPGWPYLSRRDSHWSGSAGPRHIGCWREDGSTDPDLTLMMLNRETGEREHHRVHILLPNGAKVGTSYQVAELPERSYQCEETRAAVATCQSDAESRPCLLLFHR
jgi:hypothetical protein